MSDYFDRIERQLVERVAAPSRRSRSSRRAWPSRLLGLAAARMVPTAAVLVTVAVVAVFFAVGAHRDAPRLAPGRSASELIYVARSTQPGVPLDSAVRDAVARLRSRLAALAPAVTVARQGDDVTLRGVSPANRSTVQALVGPGRLAFFDWEGDALTPDGRTVASQLGRQDDRAVIISQGETAGPGAGAGGLSLYEAVRLASRQPAVAAADDGRVSRVGPLYYLFGSPGSRACATAAGHTGSGVAVGEHCLLAGPDTSAGALRSDLPAGVPAAGAEQLAVPPGTAVLQASAPSLGQSLAPGRPTARFYVLRDRGALTGGALTDPHPGTDESGSPDVSFGFTASGQRQFAQITKTIAHRGAVDGRPGAPVQDEHFAIALDQRLLSVPSIDFRTYPDGITGGGGADISGGFTRRSARELATILRTGPLPVLLVPLEP